MTWIIVLLVLIFFVLCLIFVRIDQGLAKLQGGLHAASDLNLEAQAKTRELLDDELRRQSREREAQRRLEQ